MLIEYITTVRLLRVTEAVSYLNIVIYKDLSLLGI
jgi:hypothetical protein